MARKKTFIPQRWGKGVLALLLVFGAIIGNLGMPAERASASSAKDAYLGEIRLFPYKQAPAGWTYSDGRNLPIAQNSALFSVLGTRYGGDGITQFAIPNLRGVSPVEGAAYYISLQGTYPNFDSDYHDSLASVGEVKLFPYSRPSTVGGWLKADGREVGIKEYPQLYSRINKRYGGTNSSFALPTLENPAPILADGLYYAVAAEGSSRTSDYLGAFVSTVLPYAPDVPDSTWAATDGTLRQIYEYEQFFRLMGTRYGGDGLETFGLPYIPTELDGISYYIVMEGVDPVPSEPVDIPNDARAVRDSYELFADRTLSVPSYYGVLSNDNNASGARLIENVKYGSLTFQADGSFTYTVSGNYRGEDSFIYQAYGPERDGSAAKVTIRINTVRPEITGVSDGAYYRNDVTPTFTDGTGLLDGQPFQSGTAVSAEGTHTLRVSNEVGTVSLTFTLDKTAPIVTGVQDGKTYRVPPTLSFNEGTATLNGASFTSGTEVTTDGSYTLIVTDRVGNVTTVQFVVNQSATVSFDPNGGSAVNAQTVAYGGHAARPTAPTRTGYTFDQWYEDKQLTKAFDFTSRAVTEDVTLYAGWTANRYAVNFDTNAAGVTVPSQEISYSEQAAQPTAPKRTGYTFAGWYADAALTKLFDFAATPITQDTTVYARWTIDTYTVNFDSQGGTVISPQRIEHGAKASEPTPAPTQVGYTFDGWYTDQALTEAFHFSTMAITGDLMLYAKWAINKYEVAFDSEGGTAIGAQTVEHGSKAAEPAKTPTRTGYAFAGWYADDALTQPFDFESAEITGDTTLHAKWTINRYEVVFDSEGGSAVDTKTVEHGAKVTAPAQEPTRVGHTFGGWYADAALKEPFDFAETPVTGDTTLHAKWIINTYDVTFDSKGGTAVSGQKVDYESHASVPSEEPTQTGYTFGGWYADEKLNNVFDFAGQTIVKDTVIYAKWTPIPYKVTFDSDQGTPVNAQTVDYGQKAAEPAPPTRAGYTFGGWYEDAALSRVFSFTGTPITQDLTLHAKWTAVPVTPPTPTTPTTPPSSGGSGGGTPAPSTPAVTPTTPAPTTPTPTVPAISTNGQLTLSGGQPGEVSLGGVVKVVIPTGASDRELKVEISRVEDPSRLIAANQNLVSPVLEINKNFKENFKKPIELTLELNESLLLPGQKAAIFYYNETSGAWIEVPGTTSKNGKATVSVDHFTKFAVFGVTPKAAVSFSDTTGHWAQAAIEQAASQGFVHGYADGTFKPGALVTRAEFAAMLVGALNLPVSSSEVNFADARQIGGWAKPAVASAAAAGIIHGYADGTFRPNAVVTRAEMAAMLATALGLSSAGGKANFTDAASIPSWAAGAAEALRAAGWMNGKAGGVFDAAGKASRAEAVQLLVNAASSR